MRRFLFAIVIVVALSAPAQLASAARKGATTTGASCTVDGTVVRAVGLPTTEVVNFLVTDASGTTGWVLGFTSDGKWSVSVPVTTVATTYQFIGRTFGPNGSKYNVFATCRA